MQHSTKKIKEEEPGLKVKGALASYRANRFCPTEHLIRIFVSPTEERLADKGA